LAWGRRANLPEMCEDMDGEYVKYDDIKDKIDNSTPEANQQRKAKTLRDCTSCDGYSNYNYCGEDRCNGGSRWRKASAVA
jgi:hypothetical protein